jgi:hypothetical protein
MSGGGGSGGGSGGSGSGSGGPPGPDGTSSSAPTPAPPSVPMSAPTPAPPGLGAAFGSSLLSPSPGGGDPGASYVTAIDSSAAQLLSSAFPDGLPNPYDPGQGGWSVGGQPGDPYTGGPETAAGSAFTGGPDADPFTSLPGEADGQNWFTGGAGIDPYGGVPDTGSFTGGSLPDPDLASLDSGPASLLSSPGLLAANDVTTPAATAVASDASPDFTPQVSDTASDTGGSVYIGTIVDNGVTYYQFADISGTVYELRASTDTTPAPAPAAAPPAGGTGTYTSIPTPPDAPLNIVPPATPMPPPAPSPDPVPAAAALPASQAAADPAGPPPTPPPSPPDAGSAQSPPQDPPATPAPAVPFDPMADSPLAKWLLYGSDTPVRDFLTSDSNLRTAQNVALGVSAGALAVAGGAALYGVASGVIATAGSTAGAGSLISTAAPLATAGAGIAAANPNLTEELEEGVEGALPAVESELGTLADELESSLPSAGSGPGAGLGASTEASALFQARDEAVAAARQLVQQEINAGALSPERVQARFGTWLDALAKANVRQAVADGRLPSTFVTSPTVSLSRGYLGAWIKAPDVWDTATGRAWDFMASSQAAYYAHEASYVGETAFGRSDPGGTTITEIFPLFHAGF